MTNKRDNFEKNKEFKNSNIKVSSKFVTALAIVSIIGFSSIVSETILGINVSFYAEALLMLIIGAGLMLEAKVKKLGTITKGLNQSNFTYLITAIIGFIAMIAGIFSLPQIRLEYPSFLAIKGIIAIIAIIIIVIQTWIID